MIQNKINNILIEKLIQKASNGKVAISHFIKSNEIDYKALSNLVREADIKYIAKGGFNDSEKLIFAFFPNYINFDLEIIILYFEPENEINNIEMEIALNNLDLKNEFGDIKDYNNGFLVPINKKILNKIPKIINYNDININFIEEVILKEKQKIKEVIIPNMRCDIVGAKGFGVSRDYFQKGLNSGNVLLNGKKVKSSSIIQENDILVAKQLGKIIFKKIINSTKRGNYKIELEVFS